MACSIKSAHPYSKYPAPDGAYLSPFQFMREVFKEKEYEIKKIMNWRLLYLKKFNPKTNTLIFLCRSGTRAAMALNEAVTAGWPGERAYVILGGFQGEKMKDKNSLFYGQRVGGGWKNEGLPWTYAIDPKPAY